MGSCTHIVDDREILNQYEYDAWGNITSQKETIKNRFKFNGQQLDPITRQYYLRARFYNPVTARFTQEDTYRGDGLNLYAYCANNPIYYVDPSGNACKSTKEIFNEAQNMQSTTKYSPMFKDSPYNYDVVEKRIKPEYKANPAHDKGSPLYNPKKTPEPIDSRQVYQNSIRGGMGEWFGINDKGEIYQFFYDNNGGVHFAGIISKQILAKKNSEVIKQLGLSMKGK